MDVSSIRDQFPALADKTFLDAACVSLAPLAAAESVRAFLDMAVFCPSRSSTLHHIAMDQMREQARSEVSRLIHAAPAEIALVESTSHALNIIAEALPFERGDRVIMSDLEFLEVGVPWCQKRERMGLEIDVVPNRGGKILIEDIAARVTHRTKAVVTSSVQWSNGFRIDLDALSALCQDQRLWLVVDAIQQLGAFAIDVRKTQVDFIACGGHKWLNAPFGLGFLYISEAVRPLLRSPLGGYLSLETPVGGWGNYFQTPEIVPVRDYRFVSGARRFETGGTSNYPGAAGLAASLRLINELGPDTIAQQIRKLTDALFESLEGLDVEIVTPPEPEHRSGIVTFTLSSRERNLALMESLLARKILVSVRYTSGVGGLRASCHFFNSMTDILLLREHVSAFLAGKSTC
jgi:cysteine desulfurase / selenocysteine lyase